MKKEYYKAEIGNGNEPVLNHMGKFKSKFLLSVMFLMKKFLTKSRI